MSVVCLAARTARVARVIILGQRWQGIKTTACSDGGASICRALGDALRWEMPCEDELVVIA